MENRKGYDDLFNHVDYSKEWFEDYYKSRIVEGRWSPATIGIAYRNVRGFYNFIADKHRDNFPYDLLKRVKIPKAQNNRDQLNPDEFHKVIDFIVDNENDEFYEWTVNQPKFTGGVLPDYLLYNNFLNWFESIVLKKVNKRK